MSDKPRIGYAPGVYDLFHIGHLNLLRNAADCCDVLVAGVVSDEQAERVKGSRPIVPLDERLEIVRAIRFVDSAVVEDVPHKMEMWDRVGFDVIVKGDDWKGTDRGHRLEADFAQVGVAVAYVPYTQRTSSTLLRQVLEQVIERA
jgi:glycerol-3-phosphate cytidylyltransferase